MRIVITLGGNGLGNDLTIISTVDNRWVGLCSLWTTVTERGSSCRSLAPNWLGSTCLTSCADSGRDPTMPW